MRVSWLVLVVVLLLGLCVFQARLPEASAADGGGSYWIHSTADIVILLDSDSGRTWELANTRRGLEWEPIRRR